MGSAGFGAIRFLRLAANTLASFFVQQVECPGQQAPQRPGAKVARRSEKRLVERIAAGDQAACAEFVRAHHARIFRLLFHLSGDAHWAEDLTQETFTAAWMKIGTFNGSSTLATWLHRIAYRKFVDSYRRQRQQPDLPGDVSKDAGRSCRHGPSEEIAADEESRRLYQAIAALSQAERHVIALHYFQGLSFREVSAVLDEPAGTVKWRTSRALARLRALLEATAENDHEQQGPAKTPGPGVD